MIEQHYSPAQLAGKLGLAPRTIRRWIQERRFDVVILDNGRMLIAESTVKTLLDSHRVHAISTSGEVYDGEVQNDL